MLVDAFIYTGLSLLNQFFCDSAIIDKTLFYESNTSVLKTGEVDITRFLGALIFATSLELS